MSSESVLVEVSGRVGTITVNRPEIHNALSTDVLLKMEQALDQLERDPSVNVIVVTGAGDKAFIAGGDLKELIQRDGVTHYNEFAEDVHRVFRRFELCDKPTIAAINGYALGGGTEFILALDLRVAAENARLALPEVNLGMFPGAGGTQRIIRQIPLCFAKEMMFMGGQISASEALRMGLVNRVVSGENLRSAVQEMADNIASKSPEVLRLLKRTLRDGGEMPLGAALAHEQAMISLVFDTGAPKEGISAFLEKRSARFNGE